jgi:hypothetical protein
LAGAGFTARRTASATKNNATDAISAREKLKTNPDGSIDLYIQNESPGKDKEANWLPAPKGKFQLMMRLYWPKAKDPSILNGSWKIPPVRKVG